MASDSDDAQKIRQAEQVKTPASSTQSSSSTISKAPSFQFQNASFQTGHSPPISTKTKLEYNSSNPSNNPFNKPFNNPFRFTRMPKSTNTCTGCGKQGHWRKDCSESSAAQQNTELEGKVSYNSFYSNIEITDDFQNLKNSEFELANQE